ncbi:hypothetical protein EIL87_00285 [Saccharopolyspora rhizosphaerae]|uniref:Uncharacterized protein n=1 Tax=Saccharopolyspora rhizosphaerae TaxID=2492662 RepID=A0A3R8R7U8_9PSEU|nr:hypothetical protein [Saccharopolyspora rhizosphaerae]RRO20380.1 hypothetical protein EIL87_00285 [Saccharopolyspora rhizosphaerae]
MRGVYRIYCFRKLAVTVEGVDFLDPARAGEPGARERGVRLELRGLSESAEAGSIYASRATWLSRGISRFDLLESEPHAADRMHWHPEMSDGEPGQRVFDAELSADPLGWLARTLRDVTPLLRRAGLDPAEHAEDVAAMAEAAEEITEITGRLLAEARKPWPEVTRDERGLAAINI